MEAGGELTGGGQDGKSNWKKDKGLDAGGKQGQVKEIIIFLPSRTDYKSAAGIDMSKISSVAVVHQ